MSHSTKTGKKVIILIRSDPRKSPRSCEGIRIALGLAASGHQVDVILSDHAPLLLTESPEKIIGGELNLKFLETMKGFACTFFIDGKLPDDLEPKHIMLLTKSFLAQKIAEADCCLPF